MKVMSGAHQAVTGAAGLVCRRGRERSKARAGRTFDMPWLTGRQRVRLAWRATCVKMANLMLKLLSSGKFVIVILRMIFRRVVIVIMVNM
jgi:hypothetical protein